jgi:hypothetical protein
MQEANIPLLNVYNNTLQIIPPVELGCDRCHNCKVQYIPLEVAFATTIHKCQGMSIGLSHPIKRIIGDPGAKNGESLNPGLFYVLLSRAKTLGIGRNDSAIYFCGEHMGIGRTQGMTLSTTNQKYYKVQMQDQHVETLKRNEFSQKYTQEQMNFIFSKAQEAIQ